MAAWFPTQYTVCQLEKSLAFPDGFTVRRPTASVVLSHGGKTLEPFDAVLDTGSDFCIFPSKCLEALGIDRKGLPTAPIHGVGSDEIPFTRVTINVLGLGDLEVRAGFSDQYNAGNMGFLGNLGFFDHCTVVFDYRNHCFGIAEKIDD